MLSIVIVHFVACMWFFSSKMYDFSEETWVYRKGYLERSISSKYIFSFYWSIQTVLTVGYGDIPAVTTLEKWMSISWMMVGVGFYSYIIGTVSQVLEKMDNRKSTLKAKIDVIEVFCSETNLKPNLKRKILSTLEYNS